MRNTGASSQNNQGHRPTTPPLGLPLLLVTKPPEPPEPPELPVTVGYVPGYDDMGRG